MAMNDSLKKIDHAALRTNQIFIIGLSMAAFILNLPWLAAVVALIMAVGTLRGVPGFGILYRAVFKPRQWLRPEVVLDNPEPHRFAQGFGAAVLATGAATLFAGAALPGWGLVWLVIILAALNLFGGFCAGCAVYYWLNRLQVPGFVKTPPGGSFPGRRPK
jgi:hypothetical protein